MCSVVPSVGVFGTCGVQCVFSVCVQSSHSHLDFKHSQLRRERGEENRENKAVLQRGHPGMESMVQTFLRTLWNDPLPDAIPLAESCVWNAPYVKLSAHTK